MNENTPSTNQISYGWAAFRGETSGVSSDAAYAEFNRWLDAHDQGIRDSVKPPEMTASEYMQAAWDAAYEVPEGREIPKDTLIIVRHKPGQFTITSVATSSIPTSWIRTLDPLPPVIPDDCDLVWAGRQGEILAGRLVWHRQPGSARRLWKTWLPDGRTSTAPEDDLIDPKPVPEEER